MIIQRHHIRNLEANLPGVKAGDRLVFGYPKANLTTAREAELGLHLLQDIGDSILPTIIGPTSRFNAEGKEVIDRDSPKEVRYRQVEWTWTEWHGKTEVEQTDFRDVRYERFRRIFIPPPSMSLHLSESQDGLLYTTREFEVDFENPAEVLHAINLVLELFGRECYVWNQSLEPISVLATRSLGWLILPPGRKPWATLEPMVRDIIDRQKKGNRAVISHRLETINSYGPDFLCRGEAGFGGYLVFGFPAKDLYIVECTKYGNATYVFRSDWERVTQLTKAEILNESLQYSRFIHIEGWVLRLAELMREELGPSEAGGA